MEIPPEFQVPYLSAMQRFTYSPRKYLDWASTRDTHKSLLDDGIREFFAGEETYTLLCWHFDRLAVSWIDTLTGSTRTDLEGAKAY